MTVMRRFFLVLFLITLILGLEQNVTYAATFTWYPKYSNPVDLVEAIKAKLYQVFSWQDVYYPHFSISPHLISLKTYIRGIDFYSTEQNTSYGFNDPAVNPESSDNVNPEPSTILLLTTGLFGLAAFGRAKRTRS